MNKLNNVLMHPSENLIFIFSNLPHTDFFLDDIYHWFQSHESTQFKIIKDDNFLKSEYPTSVNVIYTITNPWTRTLYNYATYIKQTRQMIKLDKFVKDLYDNKEYCKNQYDYIDPNGNYIFRNEFIEMDFLKLSNLFQDAGHLNISKSIKFDHKTHFDITSDNIIKDIFSKDIQHFYSNFI